MALNIQGMDEAQWNNMYGYLGADMPAFEPVSGTTPSPSYTTPSYAYNLSPEEWSQQAGIGSLSSGTQQSLFDYLQSNQTNLTNATLGLNQWDNTARGSQVGGTTGVNAPIDIPLWGQTLNELIGGSGVQLSSAERQALGGQMQGWGSAFKANEQQEALQPKHWADQYMVPAMMAAMTALTGGALSGVMGPIAGGAVAGGMMGGASSNLDPETTLKGAGMGALGGLGSTALSGMSGAEAGAGTDFGATNYADTSGFDTSGFENVNWDTAAGGNTMFEGFGDYTGGMDFGDGGTWGDTSGGLLSSDIPTGYSVDGMGGTGEALPTSGGTTSPDLTSILKILGGSLLGGGGSTTGGTTSGGTTGGTAPGGVMSPYGGGGLLGGIYDYNTLDRSSEFLKQIMDQTGQYGDPYKQYRPSEAAMRNQTFMDPLSIYNRPEYQMLDKRMQDQQLAQGAQAGTLFNAPERLAQRQTGFLDYLSKLRGDLLPGSGAGLNPIAPQAAQAEMMKSYVPLEMAKSQAVGQATGGGANTIQQILQMIGQQGGYGV